MPQLNAAYPVQVTQTVVARVKIAPIPAGSIVRLVTAEDGMSPGVALAVATNSAYVAGQLGYVVGDVLAGGTTAVGDYCVVVLRGLIQVADPGGVSEGDPFYASDTATVSKTSGTWRRPVAQALMGSGGPAALDLWFDGAGVMPLHTIPSWVTARYLPYVTEVEGAVSDSSLSYETNLAMAFHKGLRLSADSLTVDDGATADITDAAILWRIFRGVAGVGNRVVRLPDRPPLNTTVILLDADASAALNNIDIQTIDGSTIGTLAAPLVLSTAGRSVQLCYNNALAPANWDIISAT